MKTLKDFYIVVTKQNRKEIKELLNLKALFLDMHVFFDSDDKNSKVCVYYKPENKQRISLSKLKRYIDNTPTREGLKKAQNASKIYKYKYDKCKKENEEQAYYIEEFRSELKELSHSNERLQDNLDNLRTEREQLTKLAKKDVNLGKKTLVDWVEYIQENNKNMYKECTVLGISNKNLELNNTKLNLENDHLNKELRKYKIITMCSLLLTLLALGLWF